MEKITKEKVTFAKDNSEESFSKVLKKEVEAYFQGKNKKGTSKLYVKTIVIFALLATAYALALTWGSILLFCATGFFIALVGFNVMHDASHGSYSNNKKLNAFLAFLGADVMGASSKFWDQKHNIMHHTNTNIVGEDDDIGKSPLFRLAPSHPWKRFHRYQHLYAWVLYCLLNVSWFYSHDFVTYRTLQLGERAFKMSNKEKRTFWYGKIIHIALFVVLPIVLLGWKGVLGIFLMHAVASLFLALVFQMAHIVEHLTFIPYEQTNVEDVWYIHELKTTANFASDNWFWTLLLGGLNFQVEHHLFRDVSHIHYPAISKIVQDVCKQMNVPYHSFPTFRQAIASHYRHLRALGRQE